MPLVKIHRRVGHPAAQNEQIMAAVHDALVAAFRIPEHDRTHLLFEHDSEHFHIASDRTAAFTLVEITAYPGRTAEAKGNLYREIGNRLARIGVPTADLFVILSEPALENWSVRNGVSALAVPPGFKLTV
jgi:phenylpyruvate tautomerase PptA (4-oxalocrotonate tautomerase family)